ncbi:hypothetical protein NA57DRAFT_82237 [Rhizodiscina lignyota]|uniref:Uncharacterized protein n=1 Tax=Rhizodiscina lignyota TaxID=1504668 RepID=A0A9P4I662_9PEZI|nr:hypothetical protein NA57DRAFT_82237 [Rhizodiscina lignyota]
MAHTESGVPDLSVIFSKLRHLTSVLPVGSATSDMYTFSQTRRAIEAKLLSARLNPGSSISDYVFGTSCIAGLIYTHFVLRQYHPRRPVLMILLRNLMTGLWKLEEHLSGLGVTYPSDSIHTLLWALCIGSCVALDAEQLQWFLERVRHVMGFLKITQRWELQQILERYVWMEKLSLDRLL